jgi:hypothetical protein
MQQNVVGAILVVFAMTVSVRANSISLPGANGEEIASLNSPAPGAQVSSGPIPPARVATYFNGLDTAVASANLVPTVSASATGGGIASASENYYFELAGPTDINIPVSLSGIAGAGLGPFSIASAEAYAEIKIFDLTANSFVLDLWDCAGLFCTRGDVIAIAGSYTQSLSLMSNTEFEIELTATANPLGTSANAVADPYIQIDPSFAAATPGFSVLVSQGISNAPVSSTPEPSTVSLILVSLGFGITHLIQRRLRRWNISCSPRKAKWALGYRYCCFARHH